MQSHLPADIRRRLAPIRLLVLDVDGVLTDGILDYTGQGEASKRFCVRDGLIIRLLIKSGIEVAALSGRASEAVEVRLGELGVKKELIVQGSRDKSRDLDELMERCGVEVTEVAAMGDDLPDLPMLSRVGFSACPADAAPEVAVACHLVCGTQGGRGAVREVGELILKAQGKWAQLVSDWLPREGGGRSGKG
jgi:3-deoxy-D-manno-octulosonate 8-phosphate phosphatase (KDO 8-P phosphatase)